MTDQDQLSLFAADTALFADVENRIVRGLVLPYNELSSPSVSNTPPVMFSTGTVDLPADPEVIIANRGHSQFAIVGRGHSAEETPAGVVAAVKIARTPEGDALLAEASNPDPTKRPRLSAEIRGLVREGQRAIKATLTGVAFVPRGAFASAALFALAEEEATQIAEAVATAVSETLATIVEPQPPVDSPSPTNQEDTMTAAAAATIPAGLPTPATVQEDNTSAHGLFEALVAAGRGAREALEPYCSNGDMFAISTVQHSGPSGVTIGADTQVPQYVQELWKRRPYERKYVPLFNQLPLTSMKVLGWRWTTEPAVASYNGNTAEIPSNAVDTEPVSADAARYAGGHKLDRRYIDFGDTSVYQSYFQKMTESYSRVTDNAVLAAAVAAAADVTAGTVPSGIADGLAAIVDGALAIIESENTPSFAVVSPELWRDIALTARNDVLGYLTASMGLESGDLGGFRIMPGAVGTGLVLVGAKEAVTVYELPSVPIRVEGIDPHHGAIDPALFGYMAQITNNAAALALVDTDPA